MNRNIKFENHEPPPAPPPVLPPPPPPKVPTPVPQRTFIPWVPYDKAKAKDVKITKSKLDFPFDLYLDAVRFLPDNSTFIKVGIVCVYMREQFYFIYIYTLKVINRVCQINKRIERE